ncbi:hypothetical protein EDB92DRAFT_1795852 [Lactarius akahatsu]|uniref:GATA-type domain-containing protein n=1 Tax=Lactarius akahatsu TaxID=416441 RepID=A0AAD4LMI3_9AGAM|nr:hypothetical protein EDB92DRAFT_1795852 [Lactarius akahatsu]
MDVPTSEAFHQLQHTGVGYGSLRCDIDRGYHHQPECAYTVDVPVREDNVLVGHSTAPSQLVGNSRGEVANLVSGCRDDQIFYTEDANVRLTQRIRRQCFNCKATETSTWRRSLLSTGKLLCNKCGLFERTHSIPRPEKFQRRKTLGSRSPLQPSLRSRKRISPDGGAVNPPHQGMYPPPLPLPAHFVDAVYPISGNLIANDMSWVSPIAPDDLSPAQVLPRYPFSERPTSYHVDRRSLSSTLSEAAIWI